MGTTTPNLGLYKPAVGETGWGALVDANFDRLDGDYIYVQDYVAGDGTTDDTAAYQAAVDDAIDRKLPLVGMWPGHTIRLDGTVNITPITSTSPGQYSNFFRFIGPYAGFQNPSNDPTDEGATKILCMNASGPALAFKGVANSGGIYGVHIDGLKIWAGIDRYKQPLLQLGDVNQMGNFWLHDCFLDGRGSSSFRSDGILVHTALVGSFRDVVMQNMAAGCGWRFQNSSAVNTGNFGWYDCTVIFANPTVLGGGVGWFLKEYYGTGSGGLVNSVVMSNCKAVCPTDTTNRYFNTFSEHTVSTAAVAGATTVVVSDATGIHDNQFLTFVSATNNRVWFDHVGSLSSNTITLESGSLDGPLAIGDQVIVGNWNTVCGPMTGLVQTVPHWENCNGMLVSGSHGIEIVEPLLGNYVPRGVFIARGSTRVRLRGGTGASSVTVPDDSVYFEQSSMSGNARNSVTDVSLLDLGSWQTATNPTIVQNDQTSLTADFEAGVDTDRVLAADAGSANAWDAVNSNTSGTSTKANINYSSTHAEDTLSALVATGSAPGTGPYMEWSTSFGVQNNHYGRLYLYLTAYHASGFLALVQSWNGAADRSTSLRLTNAGLIDLADGGGTSIEIGAVPVALNQWTRIEWHIINSTTAGQMEAKLFNTASSTTASEVITSAAVYNLDASVDRIRIGNNGSAATVNVWLDNIVAKAGAYPGPVPGEGIEPIGYRDTVTWTTVP